MVVKVPHSRNIVAASAPTADFPVTILGGVANRSCTGCEDMRPLVALVYSLTQPAHVFVEEQRAACVHREGSPRTSSEGLPRRPFLLRTRTTRRRIGDEAKKQKHDSNDTVAGGTVEGKYSDTAEERSCCDGREQRYSIEGVGLVETDASCFDRTARKMRRRSHA